MNNQVDTYNYKYCIEQNEHKFIIKQENNYFVVYAATDQMYPWLDRLNSRSITKKFNRKEVESLLKNYIQTTENNTICEKINSNYGSQYESNYNLDVNCIKEMKKICQYIDESIKRTPFSKDIPDVVNNNYISSLKIFNRKQCADIITTDYIKLYRWLNEKLIHNKTSITMVNNSIYDWRIRIDCYSNAKIHDDRQIYMPKEWDYILIDIRLHPDMYPNYPPNINIIHPKFKNDLNVRISRSKYTMVDYWNCDRNVIDIITRTMKILQKYGEIENIQTFSTTYNGIINNKSNNLSKSTIILLSEIKSHLESLIPYLDSGDDDEIDKDLIFEKISDLITLKTNTIIGKRKNSLIDNGSGYGHSSAHKWNITEYHNLINERNNKFTCFVNSIVIKLNRIYDLEKGDLSCSIDLIKNSHLYKFIVKVFRSVSILEIQNEYKYFRSIFDLIHIFCLENTIALFYDPDPNKTLYNAISNLKQRSQTSLDLDNTNENANMIHIIHCMIEDPYNHYLSKIKFKHQSYSHPHPVKNVVKRTGIIYNDNMLKYRYKIDNGLHNDNSYYFRNKVQDEDNNIMKQCYMRLSSEIPSLIESMCISENSLVIGYIDKQKPNCIRFILNGPRDTPYSNGLFIFDTYCGHNYPTLPPDIRLMNTNGHRFNPNFYADGKICLSLLGTYSGSTPHESEKWNPKLSSLSQVIISIQANIFVDHPYFNEQGFEKYRGTEKGNEKSKNYNEMLRYSTMHVSMLSLLKSVDTYHMFKNAIITHFYLQREMIVQQCQLWIDDCQNNDIKNNMMHTFIELKSELDKLSLPV
jgi:ubiquitin-protein ligase